MNVKKVQKSTSSKMAKTAITKGTKSSKKHLGFDVEPVRYVSNSGSRREDYMSARYLNGPNAGSIVTCKVKEGDGQERDVPIHFDRIS